MLYQNWLAINMAEKEIRALDNIAGEGHDAREILYLKKMFVSFI